VQQADLIWMNGQLIPWDDAKVHVLTHGLHYGTSVFEGVRCYDTELGPAVFRHAEHIDRLFRSAELYYMPIPFTREQLRDATNQTIAGNNLRSCYIRPLVFRGYGQMGLYPLDAPVDVMIACWEGGLPRRGRQARGHSREGQLVAPHQPAVTDPPGEGRWPVPQQRAGQDRDPEGGLRGGDPP
jgi:branched-subunit amino acid aminotransferase/4-amino-4-deoxychorismate lyase